MSIFQTLLSQPLFNLLIAIYNVIPGHDFGVAIIVLTVGVRLLLMPLSIKALVSQRNIMKIQPKLKEVQNKYKNDKQAQTRETMALYKEYGVNPLSGCLPLLIQLPILFGLYRAFSSGFKVESLSMLYSFVSNPGPIKEIAFGLFNLSRKSPVMAILAGGLQFIQSRKAMANQPAPTPGAQDNPMLAMNKQMLYFFPIFITIIAWNLPFGITLYWVTTTVFSIFEQIYIGRKYKNN